MHHFLEIVGLGSLALAKQAFFFFAMINKTSKKEVEEEVELQMKKFNKVNNVNIVRNTLRWLVDDDFSSHLSKDYSGQFYINDLIGLKNSYLDFFGSYLEAIQQSNPDLKNVADLIAKNEEYILQIARLRMVIDPEIQLSKNIHKQTKIVYMKVKGFWLSDDGVKERKFFKSLGRFDQYTKGVDDPDAILEGRNKIREEVYAEYLKHYKE